LARVEHRCSVDLMQLRSLTLFLAACLGVGCGGASPGKIMADTKVPLPEDPNALLVPYKAPDISELTGIDEEEEEAKRAAPTPAPAPPATEPKQ
jgi:hypothetical protein